jgi:hypothetical protein
VGNFMWDRWWGCEAGGLGRAAAGRGRATGMRGGAGGEASGWQRDSRRGRWEKEGALHDRWVGIGVGDDVDG